MSATSTHSMLTRTSLIAAGAGLVAGLALGATVGGLLGSSTPTTTEIAGAVVDSMDTQTGVVCLRQSDSNLVDCYPSAVPGLSAGVSIEYVLTSALADPNQSSGATQQVVTWARPTDR